MVVATKIRYYRKGFLISLGQLALWHPWKVVIIAALLAVFGGYWTYTHLGYQTDPNQLLEPSTHHHKNFLLYLEEFRQQEDLIVVVAGPDFKRDREVIEWLAKRMSEDPDLKPRLFYKLDLAPLEDRMLLYVDARDLNKIDERLEQYAKFMQQSGWQLDLNSMLDSAQKQLDPNYMEGEGNWEKMQPFLKDFIENLNSLADRLEGKKKGPKVESFGNLLAEGSQAGDLEKQRQEHEYLSFNSGRIMLLCVKPDQSANDSDFFPHKTLITKLQKVIREARAKFQGVEIGLTGEPALSQDEMEASTRDCAQSTVITLVLICLLFFFAYREFWRPLFAIIALLIGIAWTTGFAAVYPGHLNILSQAFVAMILGLGIDFGIQLLGRYEEALSHGKSIEDAIEEMMSTTGGAIVTGGSTTAAAFYTMCFNQFKGLAELGIIAGTGVLLCLVAEMLVLPALLVIRDRYREGDLKATASVTHWGSGATFHPWLRRHAGSICIVAAAATLLSVWAARVVTFDYNLLNLQSKNLESVKFERKLLDSNSQSMIFAISIADDTKKAKERVDKFKRLPSVLEASSITSVIPDDQPAKMAAIRKIRSRLEGARTSSDVSTKVNVPRARESLTQLKKKTEWLTRMARRFGGKDGKEAAKVFEKLVPPITRALDAINKVDQEEIGKRLNAHQYEVFGEMQKNLNWLKKQRADRPITEADAPVQLRDRYVGRNGKIMIEVYPKYDIWERAPLEDFVSQLRTVDPEVTGTPVQNYEYIELLKNSYLAAVGQALVAIVVFIMLHFIGMRSWPAGLLVVAGAVATAYLLDTSSILVAFLPTVAGILLAGLVLYWMDRNGLSHVIMTLLPLGLGIAWTLLAMPVLGIRFNPANIITLPLVVGAGVAYGVYTVDRYRESGSADIFGTSTGKAVLLSALTTMFGFGSLIIARHQGIASLGLLMTLGITMCMLAALYVLPALIELSQRKKKVTAHRGADKIPQEAGR